MCYLPTKKVENNRMLVAYFCPTMKQNTIRIILDEIFRIEIIKGYECRARASIRVRRRVWRHNAAL